MSVNFGIVTFSVNKNTTPVPVRACAHARVCASVRACERACVRAEGDDDGNDEGFVVCNSHRLDERLVEDGRGHA